ncbi:hypothetical protein U9M48_015915 [Paspalum notatum var. saurae]|uniref:No apical meristem-associated C-terminal domain-containing protein n=1 Tax=Paspalum notatum var. saurae TaxID=547442 RepID=A0AAQ3WM79_PASNO
MLLGQGTMYPPPHGSMYPPTHATMYPPHGAMFLSGWNTAEIEHTVPAAEGEDDDLEVLDAPNDSSTVGEKKGRTKLGNLNPQEDVNLVKSWLEISCDPIIGNAQRSISFWKRVAERYSFRRGPNPERTHRSLQSRWNNNINRDVGKFAGYYADALREDRSGMSDADKVSVLHFSTFVYKYVDGEGQTFGYMHCWDLLKDEPKWREPSQQGECDTSLDSNRVDVDKAGGKRPIGKDRAKAANKKCKSGDTTSSDYASKMQDMSLQKISIMQEETLRKGERFDALAAIDEKRYQEQQAHNQSIIELEREKVAIMREKHELAKAKDEKQEDERIMLQNLDECSPRLRMYYEVLQDDILAKVAARRQSRQGP